MANQWSLVRTVDPTIEPVTVQQVKSQNRVFTNDDDALIALYIRTARHFAEIRQMRSLLPQTWRLNLDYFPSWTIKIPMPPLTGISSLTYLDTQGNTITLSPSLYLVDTDSSPGRITPAYNQVWPITRIQISGVTINYTSGYPSTANLPPSTVHAILLLASYWYEHRTTAEEMTLKDIPLGALDLLDAERVLDFSGVLGSSNNIPGAVTAWGGAGWWN